MCLKHKTANAVHGKIDTDALRWADILGYE